MTYPLGSTPFGHLAPTGVTYNSLLSETMSPLDSYLDQSTLVATLIESVTAGFSITAGMSYVNALVETVSAGDIYVSDVDTGGGGGGSEGDMYPSYRRRRR